LDLYAEPDTKAVEKRWDILVHQLVNIILLSTPIILLTIFCGLKEVSMYTIYSMIFTAIIGVINIFQGGLIPYFGNVMHSNSRDILINIQRLYESGFYMVVACLFSCTFVLIIPFINIYAKEFNDINYVRSDLAIAMIILGILRTIRIPNEVVLSAAGHFKETRSRAIIEASIHVIMSVLFVRFFGVIGVVLGGICSYGYRTIDIIIYTNKIILKTEISQSFAIIGQNGVLCFISILPFLKFIKINPINYIDWFINGVGVFAWVSFVVLIGNLVFNYSRMKQLINRLTEVLKIKFVWNRLKNNKLSS
jgi:O-antigen/teichoic acid export membrane protein